MTDIETPRDHPFELIDNEKDMQVASKLFLVMGFGYIFPYCALVQPVDYWRLLFPSFNVEFSISCAYNVANFLTFVLILWMAGKQWYTGRIVGGFVCQVVVLGILPASYYFLSGENQNLWMVLCCSAVVAISGSFLDSSVFSLAALFPQGAIENVQVGIGFSILITAVYRDITKAFFSSDLVVESTMLYFGIGALTVGCGIGAYYMLLRLPLTRQCMKDTTQETMQMSILKKILVNELLVASSFVCTFLMWPGVVAAIPSYNFPKLNQSEWWPLILLTIYASCNVIGRFCVRFRCGYTARTIWKLVLPRFIMVPLLICSAKQWIFKHDVFSILFSALHGLSDGYVGTLAVVVVNDCVEYSEQSATGTFSAFSINMGIVTGATLSLGLSKLLGL